MTSPWPPLDGYLSEKQPADVAQRSFSVAPSPSTALVSTSITAAPSGVGELTLANLTVAYNTATVTVSGGVAGRVYALVATAVDVVGNSYETIVFLPMSGALATDPPVVPPSQGPGSPVTWINITVAATGLVTTLPANAVLKAVYIQNLTANAITGGLNIGSTLGGVDIAAAIPVGSNALVPISSESLLKPWFSATIPQPIYFSAVTSWNGASLNVRVVYDA